MEKYDIRSKYIIGLVIINALVAGMIGLGIGVMINNDKESLVKDSAKPTTLSSLFQDSSLIDDRNSLGIAGKDFESDVVSIVEKTSPAVVSIIITKDMPIIERYYYSPDGSNIDRFFGGYERFQDIPIYRQKGTERLEVGGGSGFLVSSDGYIITNKHVVNDVAATYSVLMNDETKHNARIIAKDNINDVAILKIEGNNFPYIEMGDSTNLKVGQAVVSIGNSLGEFRNTVSTGIISGLARNLSTDSFIDSSEALSNVIQTDAAINLGNSGGPLLNSQGQAIGINTAIAVGAENIGFSIPINLAKDVFENVKKNGRLIKPWLGVRYLGLDSVVKEEYGIEAEYGALIISGNQVSEPAITPGSPAEKAGLREGDVILEIEGMKIDKDNSLSKIVSGFEVGDVVELKILRDGEDRTINLTFDELDLK